MKLLLDECVPRTLKRFFVQAGHQCETVRDAGLGGKTNGELLTLVEGAFDVLITIDQNIRYQQNMEGRRIAVLVLLVKSNDISDIIPLVPYALEILPSIETGRVTEIGHN